MRIYLKILAITAGMQIVGVILCYLLDYLLRNQETSTIFPLAVGGSLVLISTILGIVLPVCWCKTIPKKIITILLLPTNYTILICLIILVKFVMAFGNILSNIPKNFG